MIRSLEPGEQWSFCFIDETCGMVIPGDSRRDAGSTVAIGRLIVTPTDGWPALSYAPWSATCDTVHAHTRVLGKLAVELAPPEPQLQHTALRLSARGVGDASRCRPPDGSGALVAALDFRTHEAALERSGWPRGSGSALTPNRPVAQVTREMLEGVERLVGGVEINPAPQEVPWTVPLDQDQEHATYDPDQVASYFEAATHAALVLAEFRAPFRGRSTPVNAWWGTFDLAVSFFSGRPADPPLDDFIMRNGGDAQQVGGRVVARGFEPRAGRLLLSSPTRLRTASGARIWARPPGAGTRSWASTSSIGRRFATSPTRTAWRWSSPAPPSATRVRYATGTRRSPRRWRVFRRRSGETSALRTMPDYGHEIEFGYFLVPGAGDPEGIETARLADRLGYDLVAIQDHPYQRRHLDTLALLGEILARTERIASFRTWQPAPAPAGGVRRRRRRPSTCSAAGASRAGLGGGGVPRRRARDGRAGAHPGRPGGAARRRIEIMRASWERAIRGCASTARTTSSRACGPAPSRRTRSRSGSAPPGRARWRSPGDWPTGGPRR